MYPLWFLSRRLEMELVMSFPNCLFEREFFVFFWNIFSLLSSSNSCFILFDLGGRGSCFDLLLGGFENIILFFFYFICFKFKSIYFLFYEKTINTLLFYSIIYWITFSLTIYVWISIVNNNYNLYTPNEYIIISLYNKKNQIIKYLV